MNEANLTPIARSLTAPEQPVRCAAAQALGMMGQAAKSKVPDLTAALRHEDLATVVSALWALSAMGPAASSAMPQVEPLTRHQDPFVKNAALETMKRLQGSAGAGAGGPPPAVPGVPGRPGG